MADGVQITAFEGGQLRVLDTSIASHEAVLALPLNRLIVRMVRVPPENRDDPVAFATPILQAMSPYPDEPLTVSCEEVCADESGLVVIAAALPESATEDLGVMLDSQKLSVTRIDALAIGALRGLWPSLGTEDGCRRVVLLLGVECLSLIILDGEVPSNLRAISTASDLRREVMLSLLEAEDFGGAKPLKEIIVVESDAVKASTLDLQPLAGFASVRTIEIGEDAALVGVAARSDDMSALNALPQSWREMLEETRFKKKLTKNLIIAGGIWALLMGIVFGVPMVFGFLTDHQKQLCKEHRRPYEQVSEMKAKVELVQKYSDHARGSLEILKALSDRLPQGVTLTSWNFKRDEGVRVSGEADDANAVYEFKDAMDAIVVSDEEGNEARLFPTVRLNGPTASKGRQKFDLECSYEVEGDE